MMMLPQNKMKEILDKEGANKSTKKAKEELSKSMITLGHLVAQKSVEYAKTENRKTVNENDIERALNHVLFTYMEGKMYDKVTY